jgi:hypothetical protein
MAEYRVEAGVLAEYLPSVQTPPFYIRSSSIGLWRSLAQQAEALGSALITGVLGYYQPRGLVVSQVHGVHVVGAALEAFLHFFLGLHFPLSLAVDLVFGGQGLLSKAVPDALVEAGQG